MAETKLYAGSTLKPKETLVVGGPISAVKKLCPACGNGKAYAWGQPPCSFPFDLACNRSESGASAGVGGRCARVFIPTLRLKSREPKPKIIFINPWRGVTLWGFAMFCMRCGAQMTDDALFCPKCGAKVGGGGTGAGSVTAPAPAKPVLAPAGITALKCPNCGAPIAPKYGEMVISCAYCGSGISLGNDGWRSLQKQTMLPLKVAREEDAVARIKEQMDRGLLRRHLEEDSTREELALSYVPYWLIPVSARTSIVAANVAAEVGTIATEAAVIGILGGMMGGRRRGFGLGGTLATGALMGTAMGGNNMKKAFQMSNNYDYPIVAVKSLQEYQPLGYEFALGERALFDLNAVPKNIKILNGDVSEEVAKNQAKAFVDQLQSHRANEQYHMIQQMNTEMDVADGELLYAPVWFARYEHKGKKMVLVIDGNSGGIINSIGL